MRSLTLICLAILAMAGAALPVWAASFSLTLDGDRNVPTFTLTNTSGSEQLTRFLFTIGDPAFGFDFYRNLVPPPGGTVVISAPDTGNQDGLFSEAIDVAFTGFDPGESFSFEVDVDPVPTGEVVQNFEEVFFNNGLAPSSVITVGFSDGLTSVISLPDEVPVAASYSFSGEAEIPLPPSLVLMLGGLMGLAFIQRRRWR
ncbi:MAG: hypothetical protein AAGC57_06235 [Pseudomonadota bacterium]